MKVKVVERKNLNPEEWDRFIENSPEGSFFHLTGYLDIIAGGWEALVVYDKKGVTQCLMPLVPSKKYLVSYFYQPRYSQFLGPCFPRKGSEGRKGITLKNKALPPLIDYLDSRFKVVSINLSPDFNYGLPFYWKGYELQTRYTYRIDTARPERGLWNEINGSLKKQIEDSSGKFDPLEESVDSGPILELFEKRMKRDRSFLKESDIPAIKKIIRFLVDNKLGVIRYLRKDDRYFAAGVFTSFNGVTTYLFGMNDGSKEGREGTPYLLWESIREAGKNKLIFDFEGSMIEGVERFFRSFGGKPVPYLNIVKNTLPLSPLWKKLR